jgi:D-alanine--poly(phosphoribitol) ligase subunit 1
MHSDIVTLFFAAAEATPDAPAIVIEERTWSYGRLAERIRAFASAFSAVEGARVAIALPQEHDAYAAIFGAALAGGFHSPLNVASPVEKLRKIVSQFQPDFLVATPDMAAALESSAPECRLIDPSALDESRLLNGNGTRHDLAYVMFTSGSTGDPKGVMISRAALGNYVEWLGTLGLGPDERMSQQPNLAFDISMTDIFGALCHGAALYPLATDFDRMYPADFIRRNRITVWNSTPSAVSLMMQGRQVTADNLSSVRLFNFCGEPLVKQQLDAVFGAVPETLCQNTYGPTEATVAVTSLELTKENYEAYCGNSVAIGPPIANMETHLVGGAHADEGQIVITGPQLAEGYWNDEVRTAQAFRPVPELGGVRGYYTGDWAERRDGEIYFKERMDFQVKVRGFRVELDEVASAIRDCGWPVAVVFKRGEALAAVVERAGSEAFNEGQLKASLSSKIEAHAIPQRIIEVAAVPRSDNDKLDRKASALLFEDRLKARKTTPA